LLVIAILPIDIYLTLPAQQNGVFLSQVLTMEASGALVVTLIAGKALGRTTGLRLEWRDLLPLGLVLAAATLSIIFATSRSVAVKDWLKVLVLFGIYVLARAFRDVVGVRNRALFLMLVGFVIVLICGLLGYTRGLPDISGIVLNIHRTSAAISFSTVQRAESTFRYPNELAAYLLIVLPFVLACIVSFPLWLERSAGIVVLILGMYLLVMTYTRGALVALAVTLPILLYLLAGRRMTLMGLAVVLACVALVALKGGVTAGRIFSLLSLQDAGYTGRFAAWQWAWDAFIHHPLFGVGIGNLAVQPNAPYVNQALGLRELDAENLLLNVLAEMGIVGLAAVLYCLIGALRVTWNSHQSDGTWLDRAWNNGLFVALCALIIFGVGDPVLVSGQVAGLLCAVVGLAGVLPAEEPVSVAEVPRLSLAEALGRLNALRPDVQGALALQSRVVFLINAPRYGGAEQHSMNLAAELWHHGVQVLVVVPPESPLQPLLESQGVPCLALDLGKNIGRLRGFLGTLAYLNPLNRRYVAHRLLALTGGQPTIFVCPFLREQLIATRLRRSYNVAVVWVLHSSLVFWPHRALLRRVWVSLAREADAVTTVSPRFVAQAAALGFPSERLVIIPSSVPDSLLNAVPEVQRVPGLLVVVSRLIKTKGLQYLVSALPRVLARYPTARLAIAGTGRYERALRRKVRALGLTEHVDFLGYIPQPAGLLRQASLFVYPTADSGEVLPASILEAFAVGTPVIASAIASIPDIVVDQRTGLLTRPGDSERIGDAILELLDNPGRTQAMGATGREMVRSKYTFAQTGGKFLDLLVGVESGEHAEHMSLTTSATMRAVHRPRLMSGTALFTSSKVLTALGTALWTVLAARALLPAAYGNLMLTAGLVDLGATVTDAGLSAVAIRELAQATDEYTARTLTSTLIFLKVALGLLAMMVTIGVTLLLPFGADVGQLVLVLGPSLIFVSLNSLSLVFQARLVFKFVLAIAVINVLLNVYGTVAVYNFFPSALAFAQVRLWVAIATGFMTLAILTLVYRPGLAFNARAARRLLATAFAFGLSQVLTILFVRIDVPLLALLSGSTQVAIYTSAYRILDLVSLLPVAAAGVALPIMVSIGLRQSSNLRAFAQQYLELAVVAGMLAALTLTLLTEPILAVLYGGRYAASGPVLRVLAWAGAAMFVTNVFVPLVVALDRRRTILFATALGLVTNVGLNVVLIPRFGPAGAAGATAVTELIVTLPLAWVSVRALRWRVDGYTMLAAFEATIIALFTPSVIHGMPAWLTDMLALGVWGLLLLALAPGWSFGLIRSLANPGVPRWRRVSGVRSPQVTLEHAEADLTAKSGAGE
jgi:glycosyltransferase involved in cell wall biosynthesis/O-antigen/teichoic acid export membrane protein/O-antigen ligase